MSPLTFAHPPLLLRLQAPCRQSRLPKCCVLPPHSQSARATQISAIQAQFRSLGAHVAADLAFAALSSQRDSPIPTPSWHPVLNLFSARGLTGSVLSRIAKRLGVLTVLRLDARRISATLDFLEDNVGLDTVQRNRVLAQRPDLLYGPERGRASVRALTDVGMKIRDIRQVVQRWPGLLQLDPIRIKRTASFLCSPIVGFQNQHLRSFLRRAAWVLVYDIDADMLPVSLCLRFELNLSEEVGIDELIRANPMLFGTLPDVIHGVFNFLRTEIGLDPKMVKAVVGSFPPILTCSVIEQLRPTARYLQDDLLLNSSELVRVVRAFPAVLTLDVEEDMKAVVGYFRRRGVINVSRIVKRLPPILGYDLESNIIPKMDYIEQELGMSSYDVLRFPGYFSYSLDKCIAPRTKFLQKRGKSVAELGLSGTLTSTDVEFCRRIAEAPLQEYQAFRKAYQGKRCRAKANVSVEDGDTLGDIEMYRESSEVPEELGTLGSYGGPSQPEKRRKRRFRATLSRVPWEELR